MRITRIWVLAVASLGARQEENVRKVDRLGEQESAVLRNLLKRLIVATDPGLPKLWTAAPH